MPPAKKKTKGKRYTAEQKQEILSFVEAQGRGGQTKAVEKYGVSSLTISNWRKAGKPAAPKSGVLSLDAVRSLLSNPQAAKLVAEIDKHEKAVEAAQARLDAANTKLEKLLK